jgi:hypothetical protein
MTRADIVVTSLGSDEAVEEVYAELFGGQEVCTFLFRCDSSRVETRIESRVDSDHEVSLWLKYGMILTSRNKVEKEMGSFLVEGVDLLSLLIPLPYVSLLLFHIPLHLPTSVSIFPYMFSPQSRRTIIDHWRSRTQRLDKRKSSD